MSERFTQKYYETDRLILRTLDESHASQVLDFCLRNRDFLAEREPLRDLSNIIRGPFLSCHLGYRLDKDEINRGYVTEAVKKGIEIVFDEYMLHRIDANIMPNEKRVKPWSRENCLNRLPNKCHCR